MARSAYCTDVAVRGDIAFDRGCSVQCAALIAPYGEEAADLIADLQFVIEHLFRLLETPPMLCRSAPFSGGADSARNYRRTCEPKSPAQLREASQYQQCSG
jgi:hypothetical protein